MVIISKLRPFLKPKLVFQRSSRNSGGNTINIEPTGFVDLMAWDKVHFYLCLGFAPYFLFGSLMSIFVGDAVLVDTPENYEPEDWEYEKNPVQRLLQRYIFFDKAHEHEWRLGRLASEQDSRLAKMAIDQVKRTQRQFRDYRAWYFQPTTDAEDARADRYSRDKAEHYKDLDNLVR